MKKSKSLEDVALTRKNSREDFIVQYRPTASPVPSPAFNRSWERQQIHYGQKGFKGETVFPRG